jgi:hypothetical protein
VTCHISSIRWAVWPLAAGAASSWHVHVPALACRSRKRTTVMQQQVHQLQLQCGLPSCLGVCRAGIILSIVR